MLAAPMINRGRFRLFAGTTAEYSSLTIELVHTTTVIDMLGLLTLDYRRFTRWAQQPAYFTADDLQRVKQSGITVFHPAVGFEKSDVRESSLRDLSDWNAFLAAHGDHFQRIDTIEDLNRVKSEGMIGILLGQQNSAHFRTEQDVDFFYRLGQRVSQLTYNSNRLGGGSSDAKDEGLTGYGASIIRRMNEVGMAVDVSHCSDRTTLDAFSVSRKPVLVTHSNCRALVPRSRRCKTDEAIRTMAAGGGVIGITMIRPFVRANGAATMADMFDHIDHVARIAGVEHVGIGSDVDLDGHDPLLHLDLSGVEVRKKIFDIAEGLRRRKYSAGQIRLILGGNFQRALTEIWSNPARASRGPNRSGDLGAWLKNSPASACEGDLSTRS
jgi:membrane dipeptidase